MKKFLHLAAVYAVFSAALFVVSIPAQENYATAWGGHTYVIVDSKTAGITAPVVRFPLLVRLDSTHASIFSQTKAGGADVRFTKADNVTRLRHQIESWDSTARTAVIWVLADSIPVNTRNHALRLHWGNAAATDSSSGVQVFDTTNHFQAVWHMAAAANETDATLNGFTATQNGAPGAAPALIGPGRSVSSGNYFRANGTASGKLNFPEGSDYTISAWVFTNVLPGHGTILSKHDNAYALKLNAEATSWEFFEFGTELTAAGWNWVNAPADLDLGLWKHLTGVRSGFDVMLFVNGARMDFGFSTAESTSPRVVNTDVVIGAQPTSNSAVQRGFDGILDEVRMSSAARDPNWIKLEYETQKAAPTVVFLSDTIPTALRPATRAREGFAVRAAGGKLLFQVNGAGAAGAVKARVQVLDMRGLAVSNRVTGVGNEALAWDGRDARGVLAPQGVYVVRIRLLDAGGGVVRSLEQRVPFTR